MNLPVGRLSKALLLTLLCGLPSKAVAQVPAPEITFSQSYSSNSVNYIPGDSTVSIAVPGNPPGTTVYYILGEPIPENALPYSQPLVLLEGAYSLYVRAVQGEFFSESSAAIHVDAIAPQTSLLINGIAAGAPEADGFIHIAPSSNLALIPSDSASGVKSTAYLIDVPPASCDGLEVIVDSMPAGTCQNYSYSGPFSLILGSHTIYYTSSDNVGNQEEPQTTLIFVGGYTGLSGIITTPDLPAGSTVTVAVSTDYFRNNTAQYFSFAAQGTSLPYNISLLGPATYYLSAFAGFPAEGLPAGTPIGVYDGYSPVFAQGVELSGLNFSISPDLEAPRLAVTSLADGSLISELNIISGTAGDNTGVDSIYVAVKNIISGLWLNPADGVWISTDNIPLFWYEKPVFSGPPNAPDWSISSGGAEGGILAALPQRLARGTTYQLYFTAEDLTSLRSPPVTVVFIWNGAQGEVPPGAVSDLAGQVQGTSSVLWNWQPPEGGGGYAVYSATGVFLSSVTGTSFLHSGLAPNSSDAVCVAAYNTYGESQRNCPAALYTLANIPGTPEIVAVSSYSFVIKWSAGGNPAGTLYEMSNSTDDFQSGNSTSVIGGPGGDEIYLSIPGLSAATTYYMRVRAINNASVPSAYSASVPARTFAAPPEAPVNLAAAYDPVSRKVSIFWSPAVAGVPAASFYIYRAAEPLPEGFQVIGVSTAAYYEDTALQSATFYYAVTALNSDAVESASSELFQLVVDVTPPGLIENLKVSSYSAVSGSAVLSWTAPGDNVALEQYLIKAGLSLIEEWNWAEAVVVGTTAATASTGAIQYYIVPVYSTETIKYFAVKAFDTAGNSSPASPSAFLDILPPSLSVSFPLVGESPVTRPFSTPLTAADNHSLEKVEFLVDNVVASSTPVVMQSYTTEFLWGIGAYPDGNHIFSVKAYDQYGNVSEEQFPALINYVPPAAPVIAQPLNSFSIQEPVINVIGTAETGTHVVIFVNDAFVTSVEAATAGTFYAAAVPLGGDGAVAITAQAVDSRGSSPRSAAVSGVVDSGPPGAPAGLAAQPAAQGKVTLAWSAPSGEIPSSYNIYRSALETALVEGGIPSGPLLVASGITELKFTDTPPQDGIYYYAAASVDAAQNISILSNVESVLSDSLPPTAAIILPGKTPPLGAGGYRFEVSVTEVLSEPPYLVFTPPGAYPAQLVLEPASPYLWVGTLTVTQAMAPGTGSFTFQGLDLTGNAGTAITAGSVLELQTEGPIASISFNPQAGPALKAGSYTVELALSHNAVSAPEFTYSIASGSRAVVLSSSGDMWSGLLTVDAETGEGVHNFSYSAVDGLGNTGTLLSGATYFIADTMATGAPVSLNPSIGAAGIINLSWSSPLGEKPVHYCVYRDNIQLTCSVNPETEYYTGAYSETPSAGTHVYYISALDRAGNESQPSPSAQVSSDNTPPAAPQGLSAVLEGSAINLSWSAGEGETPAGFRLYRATYTITSTAGLTSIPLAGSPAANTPSKDGIYHYVMTAVDQPRNESSISNEITVSYDAAAPEITISGVEDGKYYSGAVRPAFEAFDLNLAASSALLNGSPFVSGAAVSAPGSYTFRVNATDALGHAASKTVGFTIDKSSPAITLSGITAGGVYISSVTPVISASDAYLSTVTALLNGSAYAIGSVINQSGSYTLEITAVDLAGNTAVYSAAFSLDLPPRKVGALAAVIEDGAALALSWSAYAGDISVYKVYRDGLYLGPVSASQTVFRDTGYTPAAHIYEVAAVDSKGREGGRARAEVPAVSFALAGYGNYAGAEQALNRGFFDKVRFTVHNNGAQAVQAGPVSLAVGAEAPVSAIAISVSAGSSAEIMPVVYTSTASAGSVAGRAVLALPQGGDAAVSAVTGFTMAVRDPLPPIVEIYPEALVRGAYAKVKVKFNNRGSAPADIITAKLVNNAAAPSPEVAVTLKTQAGLTLSRGEVLQSTHDVSGAYINSVQSYFARVEPGSSYVFDPVDLAVPASAETELTITGGVYAMSNSIAYQPVSASPVFEASRTQSAVAVIPYTATVVPSKQVYDKDEEIVFTGTVRDSVSGYLLGNKAVRIMLQNKGFERYLSAVTASDGSYVSISTPAAGEAGLYYISASYPYAVNRLAQSSYSIVGLELGYSDYKATLAQNSNFTFEVPLINTGETAVDGLSVSFQAVSGAGVAMSAAVPPAVIEAGARKSLSVTVSAAIGASSSAQFTLKLREAHGFERTMPVIVSVVPAQVIPKLTPQAFEMGMLAGETRTQSITVENIGFSTWTGVTITAPTLPWVKLQGPQELGDIGPGQNVTLTLLIQPPAGLSNGSYAQNPLVVLNSQNNAPVPVNAGLVITSVKQGNAAFTVINSDKELNSPSRWIGGADVTLTSLDIPGLSLKVKSDLNGLARLENVPTGKYAYRSEASGFNTGSGMLSIESGLTKELNVYLPTSMVTYKWSVTPTTITDKYDITLDMTFRTDVPAPALVASPKMITLKMQGGETTYTQYTLTNKGLVSAFDIKINNSGDGAMTVESALARINELKPGQTVVIPLKVTLAHASTHGGKSNAAGYYNSPCGPAGAEDSVGILAGDVDVGAGGTGRVDGGGGGWSVAGAVDYVAVAVTRPAAAKRCGDSDSSDNSDPSDPYKHRPDSPPGRCPPEKPLGGLNTGPGSLGIDWQLYYDPGLKSFYETSGWTIEEQPDGSVLLTDEEGNKILYVVKGQMNPDTGGACGQYDDVPGYSAEVSYAGGRYTVAQKSGNSIEFSRHGDKHQPDIIRDTNNTTLTYAYDEAGRVKSIKDVHGRLMNFAYDGAGRKTEVSDFTNRHIYLGYDGAGRLNSLTGVDGGVETYAYGADGRMSAITHASGAHEYMSYDSKGRLLSYSEDGDNNKNTYVYNDLSSTTLVTDALGRRTLYEHIFRSGRSEIAKITKLEDNSAVSFEYDGNFNRTKVTDALGRETALSYGRESNLLSVTDPLLNTTTMRYGLGRAANNIAAASSNRYAAFRGAAAAAGCPSGGGTGMAAISFSPAADGPYLTSVTDPLGNTTEMDYDLNGNMTEVKDAQGNKTLMSYDQQGHVLGAKDPLGHVSSFEYNNYGGLIKVTDPLGRITELTRDELGRVLQTKDPKNKLTLFDYDVKGNLTKVTDAIGGITQYNYTGGCPSCGGGDLLATVKDAKNQQTNFAYDLQKRLTEVKNPVNETKKFEYDKKGNLTKVTDAKQQVITFEYDVLDRLTLKHLPEGDVTYVYDVVDNLTSVTSPEGQLTFAYDALNRVTQTTQRFPLLANAYTLSYAYDSNGNRTQMTSPWDTTSYTYDALNRLTSLTTNPDNKTVTFTYDALGRRTKMTYPNGTETTYAYDAASQLTQILHRKTADNTAIAFSNYNYDPAGNRTQMQDLTGTHSYGYDDLHRLITADHPAQSNLVVKNEVFNYDAVGNRLSDAVMTNYQHNAANRLTENSSYTYTYDANGNLTGQTEKVNSAHTSYAYNSENQLKQVTMPDNTVVSFKYDPLGRRIEKASPAATTRYLYDNEDIIATLGGNNTITSNITHGPGIDEPLIMKKADGTNYYYNADGLGSIISLTDNIGVIVETVEYQAYGKPIVKDHTGAVFDSSTIGNFYLFTAREYDYETGLFYYRARYYSAESGRFLQEDPIGFAGNDINFYSYVANNPINSIDAFGLIRLSKKDRMELLIALLNKSKGKRSDCEILAETLDLAAFLSGGNISDFASDVGDLFSGGSWSPSGKRLGGNFGETGFQDKYMDPNDPGSNQVRHFIGFFVLGIRYGATGGSLALYYNETPGRWPEGDMNLGFAGIDMALGLHKGSISLSNIGDYVRSNICESDKCEEMK